MIVLLSREAGGKDAARRGVRKRNVVRRGCTLTESAQGNKKRHEEEGDVKLQGEDTVCVRCAAAISRARRQRGGRWKQ
jgi:hypothetical protein